MSELLTITSEGVTLRQEIADAGARLAAGIVDGVILVLLLLLLTFALIALQAADPTGVAGFVMGLAVGGAILILVGYHVLFHQLAGGRTPGKMLLAIRVVSADGYPPSFLALVLRALVWPIDVLPIAVLPMGLIVIALSPRRQRLGDIVAGTVVVHARERATPHEPWPGESWTLLPERTLPLSPSMLARIDARDVELLRQLITRPSLAAAERRRLFVDAARYYAERLELGAFADARVVLRELYLFAREFRTAAG